MTKKIVLWTAITLVLSSAKAHAYVDPTTSNVLLQILSGVFIVASAGYVFLRNQILRLLRAVSRLFRRQAL